MALIDLPSHDTINHNQSSAFHSFVDEINWTGKVSENKKNIYLFTNMKQRYFVGYNQVLFIKTPFCEKKLDGRVRRAV